MDEARPGVDQAAQSRSLRRLPGLAIRRSKERHRLRGPRDRAAVLFSLPVIALTVGFLFLPIVQTFYYSLTTWDGITSTFVGLQNYESLFADINFWRVLLNNGLLLASIPIALLLPLLTSFMLNEHVIGWRIFRSAYFVNTAISWVVVGMIGIRFFASDGILNDVLGSLGLGFLRSDLLSGEYSAMLAIIITFIWSVFGTNTIIFLTGMATLDRETMEAARVDGAGPWAVLRYVTVPALSRFIQFAFILTLITAFTALFSLIFIMTSGGPGYATTTLEFFVFQKAFKLGFFGYAAAIGVVLFLAVFAISLAQLRMFRSQAE